MALESATYINGLVATNPASGDAVAQADDHLRLIKATLKATFPNITGPVTVTQNEINAAFPSGGIIMWSGSSATIPAGWVLCDGNNSTPDLRGRFVVGAGGAYDVGNNGGNSSITLSTSQLPSHSHTATSTSTFLGDALAAHTHALTDPGHKHYSSWVDYTGGGGSGLRDPVNPNTGDYHVDTNTAMTGITIGNTSAGTPTGTVSTTTTLASVGSGASIDIRNPYYALCYIMKV